jgi:hypothetical protein
MTYTVTLELADPLLQALRDHAERSGNTVAGTIELLLLTRFGFEPPPPRTGEKPSGRWLMANRNGESEPNEAEMKLAYAETGGGD